MRTALILLAALLCMQIARSDPIPWSAKHVQSLEDNGIVDRAEPSKYKKKKKTKASKEKSPKKSKKKSAKKKSSSSKPTGKDSPSSSSDEDKKTSTNNGSYGSSNGSNNGSTGGGSTEGGSSGSTNDSVSSGSTNDVSSGNNVDGCSGDGVLIAPKTFCVDWVPGIGYSKACPSFYTEDQGGEVCNIVSEAWLRALTMESRQVDLVITHAGICQADIMQGTLTQADIDKVLPKGFGIVLVKMSGNQVKLALEQGVKAALNGNPKAYPYGAGVRFKVDYNRDSTEGYVYDIQVKPGFVGNVDGWQALEPNRVYHVATNSKLAEGGAGYGVFNDVGTKHTLAYTDAELFTKYATNKCELDEEGAPYSTLNFQGLEILLATPAYKCLEDVSLCQCGLC